MKRLSITVLMTSIMLFFNACSTNPVTGKKDVILMSEGQELAMGQEADPQIVAQFGMYENPAIQRFIDEKGQAMAAVSHRSNIKYNFKVLDSPVINAFAVPGGYVYFTRGIMAHFNNEAQFAGVLGHEIGHIAARHSAQQQSKSILAQVGLIAGMVIAPELAQFGDVASQGLGLLFLKFGRDDERQSDELGVEYSTKIGYDADEMADFFLTLKRKQEESGQAIPEFLSTHPDPGNRYTTVHELAAQWEKKLNVTNLKVGRDSYLRLIDGIVYGEDPKQGFVENQIFYHPELKFQFPIPQGWKYLNSPQSFQMAEPNGKAIINLTLAPGTSLEDAARQTLEGYKLTLVESKNVTVNGNNALAMVAEQKQEQGTIGTLTYFIQYGSNIYSIMGITTAADFNNYFNTFSGTMTNFKQLTDQSKINKKPERVRIKTVANASSLSQALQSFGMPTKRLEELAVLNGMQLNDRVDKGMLLKVITE
ncbi:M48 family metalloprotease [Pontibacter sp. BT310]|uniref:M48 family metalloprotease n=1 Tax=Pontibacter populi TaxID=890055 RepID=A0ABS6XDP4_9BACT|nr:MULTISPECIES: M48 family metalloprotease [Pontibacter]MBJ6119163.1 M48 family metalloprotease [Pontibacter sp. BT310]MBR0571591.1 M48 family metalloprotease [Microvirga sp. STS03]MBW3366017.1 M48 family metalloprotease [Pontibacter populi]